MKVPPATSAIAHALRAGGVSHVAAFPGSPATVLAQAFEAQAKDSDELSFRWSVNEASSLSHALGCSMAGKGSVCVMKHVGVNVALDALQVMGVVHGLPAPLILVEGADARPGSSQSAQDNRPLYSGSPNLLVLTPSGSEECGEMALRATEISRVYGMAVVLRGDARMYKGGEDFVPVESSAFDESLGGSAWPERDYPLATTARAYEHHLRMRREVLAELQPWVEGTVERWDRAGAKEAVVLAAHMGHHAAQLARDSGRPGIRLRTENPLPEAAIAQVCEGADKVWVIEECLGELEDRVRAIAQRHGAEVQIAGRRELGDEREIGWIDGERLAALFEAMGPAEELGAHRPGSIAPPWTREQATARAAAVRSARQKWEIETPISGFPASDVRVQLFEALRALDERVFVASDPGITGVLALGSGGSDVKMHMGAAVPIAAGWASAGGRTSVAVVGDTNLAHGEWLGIVESAAAGDDVLVVLADNGRSEMTQSIVTLRPSADQACASFAALGMAVHRAELRGDDPAWREVLSRAAAQSGPRLVWMSFD